MAVRVRRRRPVKHLFIPYSGKIADITHADTNLHPLTLANGTGTGAIAGETREVVAVWLKCTRIAGTGVFYTYPNEGATPGYHATGTYHLCTIIAKNTQRLQYALSVANDDWDLYCLGYVVET